MFEDSTGREYQVVRNDEEQYSVWPTSHALPAGWVPAGGAGTKEQCLAEIAEVWTDLRPRSVREAQPDGAAR
jgi:MbtH protein